MDLKENEEMEEILRDSEHVSGKVKGDTEQRTKPDQSTKVVVFRTPNKYGVVFKLTVCLTIVPLVLVSFLEFAVNPEQNIVKMSIASVFLVATGLLSPIRLDVRSDGSVGLATLFVTWWFGNAVRAYRTDGHMGNGSGRRIKFVTDYETEVCVKRPRGKADLYVSPIDPDGFVQAINNVVQRLEEDDEDRESPPAIVVV